MYIFSCVPQKPLWTRVHLWVLGDTQRNPGAEASIKRQEPPSQGVTLMCLNQSEHLLCGCSCFHEHFWFLAKEERGKAAKDLQAVSVLTLKHMERTSDFCDLHVMPEIAEASLGFLRWAGKVWEQQPIQQSWGAHLMGATLPVIWLLRAGGPLQLNAVLGGSIPFWLLRVPRWDNHHSG